MIRTLIKTRDHIHTPAGSRRYLQHNRPGSMVKALIYALTDRFGC